MDIAATAAGAKACTWPVLKELTWAGDKPVSSLAVICVLVDGVVPELAVPPAGVLFALTVAVMLPDTLAGLLGFAGVPSEACCATDKLANWLLVRAATCSGERPAN